MLSLLSIRAVRSETDSRQGARAEGSGRVAAYSPEPVRTVLESWRGRTQLSSSLARTAAAFGAGFGVFRGSDIGFFTWLLSNNDAEGRFLPPPMTKDETIGFGSPGRVS